MTHSSHRFTTLSADDVALCRAHSRAVASEPDYVLWARVTDTKASLAELNRKVAYRAACDDFERVTLNQAQSDAYWQWQREVHAPVKIGFDLGAPEGDTTVIALAPAKPAAEQPARSQNASGWRRGQDVPVSERVGLWHYKTSTGGDISEATQSAGFGFNCDGKYRKAAAGVKLGEPYDESKYTAPAQQPAQKASTEADYLVCIGVIPGKSIGDVVKQVGGGFDADYWCRCDESGWVTHVPKEGAKCPVPKDILCAIKYNDGDTCGGQYGAPGYMLLGWEDDIIAWRPIAQS